MSFTVTRKLTTKTLFPQLGITISNDETSIEVTYTPTTITDTNGETATIGFNIDIPDGDVTGYNTFSWNTSNTDYSTLFDEGVAQLKLALAES